MKIIKVNVDNSCIMDSYEKASLKITSPTGRCIYIRKCKLNKASKEQVEVFHKFNDTPMTRFIGEKDATVDDMKILLELSKL